MRDKKAAIIMQNLFSDVPDTLQEELSETLVKASSVRIEWIVSHGQASPADFWYDQPEHEWVVVLKGAARLQCEDEFVDLRPGDFLNIHSHQKHRVDWTTPNEPTVWLAVFYQSDKAQVLAPDLAAPDS